MTFDEYRKIAGQAIVQAAYIFDLSRSAEHLTTHPSKRDFSSKPKFEFQNVDINSLGGVLVNISIELNAAINISTTGDIHVSPSIPGGKIPLNLDLLPELEGSRVNPFVARLSIIEQFELLKRFLQKSGAPFNEKRVKASRGTFSDDFLDHISFLVSRRNELTHEIFAPQATMKNAIEYCYKCLYVAEMVYSGDALIIR